MMDLLITFVLFTGGLLAGFYGSTVGSGGLVTFPLLILSGLPTHIAIGTNRFSVIFLELFGALRFHKGKKMDFKAGIFFGVAAALGGALGYRLVLQVNETYLNVIVGLMLLGVAAILLLKDCIGLHKGQMRNKYLVAGGMFLLGVYGGFFGAGFGTFSMFLLVVTGFTFVRSAAIARVVGVIMSIVATLVFVYYGVVEYGPGLVLGLGSGIGAWMGAGVALKKGNAYVKALFIIIVLVTVVKLLFSIF